MTTQVESLNIIVEVGGMPVRIRTAHPDFAGMVQSRYTGFLGSGETSEIDFDVEIKPGYLEENVPDVQVKLVNGRWELTRGDFQAEWEPEKQQGRVVQGLNPIGIDAVLRIVHSLVQARRGGFLLHSASVVRHGKAYLFAGESGAGKSTISGLAPSDVKLLTDEISYVRRHNDEYLACGTPFTGEVDRPGENISAPVAALYLLAKGTKNRIDPVTPSRAVRKLLSNILFFARDEYLAHALFNTAFEFVNRVPVSTLTFVPDACVWELIG